MTSSIGAAILASIFILNMVCTPEKPSAEEFLFINLLVFGLAKEEDIRYITANDVNGLTESMQGKHRDDPGFTDSLRAAFSDFANFNRVVGCEVSEEEARSIILAHYHANKWPELIYCMRIMGEFPAVKELTYKSKKKFMRTYAMACLLEPYKDLVTEMITTLANPDGINEHFKLCMKEGRSIDQKETVEFVEFANEFLCAKLVFLIFHPTLVAEMIDWFKRVYKILPDEVGFSCVLGRFFARAVPLISESHRDDSVINDMLRAVQQQSMSQITRFEQRSIDDVMNATIFKPSASDFFFKTPLVFAIAKSTGIKDIIEAQLNRLFGFFSGIPRDKIKLNQSLSGTLTKFSDFGEILKCQVTEEEVRHIILAYFYSSSPESDTQLAELARLIGIEALPKPMHKRHFLRVCPIAFLLKPYKDLVEEMLYKIADPNEMQARFMFYMRQYQAEKIPIKAEEVDELLKVAGEYLYMKLVFYIFEPDLIEKMGHWFKIAHEILPDGLDFSHVLERFLPLAIPMAYKSHLPDPDAVINSLVCMAQNEALAPRLSLPSPPGL